MSEEIENERDDLISAEEAVEEAVDNEESEQEPDGSEMEQDEPEQNETVARAKKYGHLSKEEWIAQGRDPDQWKSPEEFDKVGKILEQVYSLRKQMDQRDREIKALVEYQERTSQREYERAKADLESRLASARDDMDVEGVEHYKEELVKLNYMEQQQQQQNQQNQRQAALNSFKERNAHWFNDRNPDLVNRAVAIDDEIKADINAGRLKVNSLDEIGTMIEKRMQYEYPDRVLKQTYQKPPSVPPSRSSVNKTAVNKNSAKSAFKNLSQEHKDTYNVYKRINPNITEADFIARLKKDGEI